MLLLRSESPVKCNAGFTELGDLPHARTFLHRLFSVYIDGGWVRSFLHSDINVALGRRSAHLGQVSPSTC